MIKLKFIYTTGQITLLALAFLFPAASASAINIDPFAFCTNSCKSPGLCEKETKLADQCRKVCSDDSMWKHVASLQMSQSSKDFRTEKDQKKKEAMLYKSPIAKCLGKTDEPHSTLAPAGLPNAKLDLCEAAKAAVAKEKTDLEKLEVAVKTQEQNMAAILQSINPKTPATTPQASH